MCVRWCSEPNAERRLDLPFDTRQGAGGWYISIPKITNSISLMRYQGKITNWKSVGGPDAKITLYGRENSSGTYSFFKDNQLTSK